MSRHLFEPILDRGIRNAHFFNGRLLTADDLKVEQAAARRQHGQLGAAVGDGVVRGLEVKLESPGSTTELPVVVVTKGLAFNRQGQALELPDDERVALVRKVEPVPPEAGLFADCGTPTQTFTNLQNGVYVLALAPASGYDDYIPVRGHRPSDSASGCGRRYAVEGAQFRLLRLDVSGMSAVSAETRAAVNSLMPQTDAPSLSRLRNLLAYLCFGAEETSKLPREPLSRAGGQSLYSTYGAMDFMRSREELTDCEVPLALVYWRGGTIRFADMWSVRRRVTPRAESAVWPPLLDERRASEGEAMIRQFHEHAESLRTKEPFPQLFAATNFFRYLPPAGILPLQHGATKGFSADTFFRGLRHRRVPEDADGPEYVDGALLRRLMREAADHDPIDLTDGRMLWLYRVAENETLPGGGAPAAPYVVFAAPHVPYQATPRFDVARWDLSNYARCEDCET